MKNKTINPKFKKIKPYSEKYLSEIQKENNEPTKEDLESKEFNAVWEAIKKWDIGKLYPDEAKKTGRMYSSATGTDVMTILNALKNIQCEHEADNILLLSNPPQYRCKKCGKTSFRMDFQ